MAKIMFFLQLHNCTQKKRWLLSQTPLNLCFIACVFLDYEFLRLGLNNHLININYHQKILFIYVLIDLSIFLI